MAFRTLQLGSPSLRTRVAKRMFALFLVCALLPVAAFAVYAHLEVQSQLESEARDAIGRDAKTAGMSILERLLMADVGLLGSATEKESPRQAVGVLERRIAPLEALNLDPGQLARLSAGSSVLRVVKADFLVSIELIRVVDGTPDKAVVAVLDPHFVFTPERAGSEQRYWVEDEAGTLLFVLPDEPASHAMLAAGAHRSPRQSFELLSPDGRELASVWPLFLRGSFGRGEWRVGMSRSEAAVLRPLMDFERLFPVFAILTVALAVFASLRQIRRTLVPLDALAHFAREIGAGDLDARAAVRSGDEFEDLGAAFDDMASQIGEQVAALRRLNKIGQALSREADVDSFLALALDGSAELTRAELCALVLGDEERGFETVRFRIDGRSDGPASAAPPSLAAIGGRASSERRILRAERDRPRLGEGEVDWRELAATTGLEARSLLAVPLRAEKGASLGALVFVSQGAGETAFSRDTIDLAESLASQAAAALRQARNVETLRGLFEGLIHLTVRAIDEKSDYTGEHCRKVPILTELIAEAACGETAGALKDFSLSDEELYELRIAALLHDCGKVVTPVHVMDKATKLETLFDRIELVRTRFALLRRDVEIASLREQLSDESSRTSEDSTLRSTLERLDDDLAFIEWANRGRESMSPRDQSRVAEIARAYSFGGPDGVECPILTDEEVINLSISRGTLNEEERQVMEDHVLSTINLLEELPFPKELENVPYIAGAHHEHVDGSGYPKGLGGERLTMQARILGLADVFEALTAKTRPYKPGMTLSQTLDILEDMRDAGHIDPRLHELFIRQKVYLRYAKDHLDPQQIDSAHWADLEELTGSWSV